MVEDSYTILEKIGLNPFVNEFAKKPPLWGIETPGDSTRAMAMEPFLLLLDEPSLGLAPLIVKQIFEIVKKINTENNTTIFPVEQNANLALKVAGRGYVMENGRITPTDFSENLLADEGVKKAYLGF